MLIQTVPAFLLVFATIFVRSQEIPTCSDLANRSGYKFEQCRFENDDVASHTVRCDILERPTSTFNNILHIKALFEVVDPVNGSLVCLRLSSFQIDRVSGETAWTNASFSDLLTDIAPFISAVDYIFLSTEFLANYPVAMLELNNCQEQPYTDCNPVKHVDFLLEMESADSVFVLLNAAYWESQRRLYDRLGGFNTDVHLDFGKNFDMIKPEMLSNILKNLNMRHFRLTGLDLHRLDNGLMDNMKFLKTLNLSKNKLVNISSDIFLEARELEILSLSGNKLKEVPAGIENLRHLKQLDLSNNPIKIGNEFSDGIVNLSNHYPSFMVPCKMTFQLEVLNLSYCDIQTLNNDDFRCQRELRVLDLSHNKLEEIPSEIVSNQKKLVTLNISNNILTESPHLVLHDNISVLDASHNKMEDNLNNIILMGKVKFLDLSGNNISNWSNANAFYYHVENLNLSRNNISFFSKEMIKSFEYLNSVDLGANLYDCSDCHLPEFQNWLRTENSTKIYNLGSEKPFICISPVGDSDKYIINMDFDDSLCKTNYFLNIGVPVISVIVLILVCLGIFYYCCCRTKPITIRNTNLRTPGYDEIYKYDAYVYCSESDHAWVIGELTTALDNVSDKYRLCIPDRDCSLDSTFVQNIATSMETSRYTIMILTKNFLKDVWFQWLLEQASHKLMKDNLRFLIFIELEELDSASFSMHLRYLITTGVYIKWPQNNKNVEASLQKLEQTLGTSIHQYHNEKEAELQV